MHFYEFGGFRIDLAVSRLQRGTETIPVPPKAFDLLVLLARNSDRVMSKRELMESLWPNTFVEEANLTQHIYTLRKALGDRSDGAPYIETVPRRGYRLAADLQRTSVVAASRPPATMSDGERKRATVLQCGIANAGAIAETLGAVEMLRLSKRLHTIGEEEVTRFDGVVTERQPDGFVALFGAKEVHEDDARRAILTARALDRRVREIQVPQSGDDQPVTLKSGIATGPLVISRIDGERGVQYVAVGDALRAAAVLQQSAEPGVPALSHPTERAIERRALAAFIGRQRETSLLDGLFAEAVVGQGQVVGVVGEPGMGKSRLVHEAAHVMARTSNASVLEGRCVSYGSLVPYLPIIDLLRAHCDVTEADSPERLQRAVDRAIRDNRLVPDAGTWLLRLIRSVDAETVRDSLSPEAVKARTFDTLRVLFLNAAARRPLVMLVEDVH